MTGGASSAIRVAVAHFPSTTAAVPKVRRSTVHMLTTWSVDPDAVSVAEVVVCELASNAAKASYPDDVMAIRLTATSGSVLIEVWDSNDAGPRITDPNTDSEDGRGLLMVGALSSRWSWYRAKTGGKVVWAQIPGGLRPEPTDRDAAMPTRAPTVGPEPTEPVTYRTDPETLQRVADALRGLDTWHRPYPPESVANRVRVRT
ncbi:serine/threonine-protein kinase RsbW [Frankia sp. AiPs1]|uniref:ATP-binding protein n=1 Tax=Frankia sp. AiPa1 TaxID=573492 RepID=UPI00202B7120|nr:ATP-binding protein [Frankia sp. AiPa1]MCL9758866.1 ATP-binding protein [Frankia sp. AiPa1]